MIAASFIDALASDGPVADRADKMKLYGWLIGRWTMDATVHLDEGNRHHGAGEIYFGWTLQGRAIQDVRVASFEAKIGNFDGSGLLSGWIVARGVVPRAMAI